MEGTDSAGIEMEIVDHLVQVLEKAGGFVPTHDILTQVEQRLPHHRETNVLEHLLSLVTQGHVATRSDHGTIYFALRTQAS